MVFVIILTMACDNLIPLILPILVIDIIISYITILKVLLIIINLLGRMLVKYKVQKLIMKTKMTILV